MGHVPAIKNRRFAIVSKNFRDWKRACIEDFVSQLLDGSATAADATSTTLPLSSLIASLPPDDNWCVCNPVILEGVAVPKGEEGADILIELLP